MGGVEGVASYLDSIEEGKEVNAFLDLNPKALEEARLAKGKLAGLAIAVKSNISARGLRATCASRTLENYVAGYDATVVERIRREGGTVIGMTNMDEFACGSSGETSAFGPTQNPAAP
ncbi:MAG: Asp-tRNA(Asn)/Glu-tRNA(Gln) amidotransferase GatCAB subunit A, partial [Euryarchaeota archaeon]|nr:Asp-tRNA(Asn)/Glu-tRNA(Gln) amidotransferase GatCAB subunit A [Euryarchaeota archaeon]